MYSLFRFHIAMIYLTEFVKAYYSLRCVSESLGHRFPKDTVLQVKDIHYPHPQPLFSLTISLLSLDVHPQICANL